MSELVNAWPQIRAALSPNLALQGLVDSCLATYDGVYTLSAPPGTFPALAANYPDLAYQVFTITQQPLRVQVFEQHTSTEVSLSFSDKAKFPSIRKTTVETRVSPQTTGASPESMHLSAGASTVTDAILQPESIAAVPMYLLRFIPYVGTDAVLVAIALRQAFYRLGKVRSPEQSAPRAGDKVSLEVERILSMLGGALSRATYFRLMKSGALDWFVTNLGSGHQVVRGQVQRLPNEYQYRGALLTPGDASDLADYLLSFGLLENPAKSLASALATPRNQILQFPYRVPGRGHFTEALSVADLLRQLLPNTRLNPELLALCDALSTALIRPESFLAVPWYWFKKVLPAMGTDLGGLYLMARACGYTDWASGKDRDRFWVQGGEATLQAWVRSKSLPRMIPAEKTSSAGRPRKEAVQSQSDYVRGWRERSRELARGYLLRSSTRVDKADPSQTDWQLRVGQTALTSEDQTLRDAVYAFLCAADQIRPALPEALLALRQSPSLQNALLAAAHYREDETPLALLSRGVREAGGKGLSSCHSERSEESSPSDSEPEDPSQNMLRMTKGNQITPQNTISMTELGDGHCEEREQRSNLGLISVTCHSERSEESSRTESGGIPLSGQTAITANYPLICHFETLIQEGICHSETLSEAGICHFETLRQTLNCYFETLVAAGICDFETVIQILLKIKNTAFFSQDISNTEDPRQLQPTLEMETETHKAEVEGITGREEDFAQLFRRIDPRKAAEIWEKGLQTQFVAWVIYGALNEKIKDPLNLAVAKTLLGAQVPNPACLELASLGKEGLLAELEAYQTQHKRGYLGGDKWLTLHKQRKNSLTSQLAELLISESVQLKIMGLFHT